MQTYRITGISKRGLTVRNTNNAKEAIEIFINLQNEEDVKNARILKFNTNKSKILNDIGIDGATVSAAVTLDSDRVYVQTHEVAKVKEVSDLKKEVSRAHNRIKNTDRRIDFLIKRIDRSAKQINESFADIHNRLCELENK